jgi:MFS family permease
LVRGYHEDEMVAGLRMAMVPVAIGIVAPFSGGLAARYGARFMTILAMALCAIAIVLLAAFAQAQSMSVLQGLALLAAFGAGLGLYIGPSNNAAIGAAPSSLGQEAGALLNLTRVLGTSVGVASASATLSWAVVSVTHTKPGTFLFAGHPILAATEANFALLFCFTLLAVMACLLRDRGPRLDVQQPG